MLFKPAAARTKNAEQYCSLTLGLQHISDRISFFVRHPTQMDNLSVSILRLLPATAALVLAGCASAPLSYVEGIPQTRTDPTLYPVRVVSIDGSIRFGNKPVQVFPGPRWMVFEAAHGQGIRAVQKSFLVEVEPCSRYFFAAKKSSPLASDWSLVVDRKQVVGSCNVEEELKKAAAGSGSAS